MKIKLSDWEHMTYEQLENKYNISREQIYKIILDQKLYLHRSVIERYRLSELEHLYILKSNNLSISQLANMFHKSYNAMLMQIKAKGYYDRIKYRK